MPLTDTAIKKAKPGDKARKLSDGRRPKREKASLELAFFRFDENDRLKLHL